jgi:hypothetical protein
MITGMVRILFWPDRQHQLSTGFARSLGILFSLESSAIDYVLMDKSAYLNSQEFQKQFYKRLCTESEIERVFAPQNATDYLLKIRADYIIDHMRVYRFYRRRWLKMGKRYSLESSFRTDHYYGYLKMLGSQDRKDLLGVTFGDIFTSEANGEIFHSPFGPIVTISQSLHHFLEFSHLALMTFHCEIPSRVRFAALVIALRVMFQYESLDFDADPRGKVSPKLLVEMRRPIAGQLKFIAGHEFAHYLLGHLSDKKIIGRCLDGRIQDATTLRIYNTSEQEELNADFAALMKPQITDRKRTRLLNAVLIWFGALELYQYACDILSPPRVGGFKTHPSARERHLHLAKNIETKYKSTIEKISESIIKSVESFKGPLQEYLALDVDSFETYGSIYLDAPNTKWRGKELLDRIDYY